MERAAARPVPPATTAQNAVSVTRSIAAATARKTEPIRTAPTTCSSDRRSTPSSSCRRYRSTAATRQARRAGISRSGWRSQGTSGFPRCHWARSPNTTRTRTARIVPPSTSRSATRSSRERATAKPRASTRDDHGRRQEEGRGGDHDQRLQPGEVRLDATCATAAPTRRSRRKGRGTAPARVRGASVARRASRERSGQRPTGSTERERAQQFTPDVRRHPARPGQVDGAQPER